MTDYSPKQRMFITYILTLTTKKNVVLVPGNFTNPPLLIAQKAVLLLTVCKHPPKNIHK